MSAHVAANATPGDNMGFIVLTKGAVTRRIPYYFEVSKPALANVTATELRPQQSGDTVTGRERRVALPLPVLAVRPAADVQRGAIRTARR